MSCVACDPGYNCPEGSTTASPAGARCPEGSYCNPANTITPCPAGTYGSVEAGTSFDHACQPCPAGRFCVAGSTTAAMTASTCPAGYICPEGTESATQYPCPSGTYQPLDSQVSFAACLTCANGTYCAEGSSSNTNICRPGYYCPAGTTEEFEHPCPAGTYLPTQGAWRALECLACPPGYWCPVGSSDPVACPEGTYNPNNGSASEHQCVACTAGFACPLPTMSDGSAVPCAVGHYCPSGTTFPTQYQCPNGTYTDSTSLTRPEDCTVCPPGSACPMGSGGVEHPPEPCAAGHYCTAGTYYSTQHQCPPGTYTPRTNLTGKHECNTCPAGMYCIGGEAQPSGACAVGHYCPPSTRDSQEFPCPAGTYTLHTNLTAPGECTACPHGHYCVPGTADPEPCNPGSFSNRTHTELPGPGSFPSCQSCPGGYRCTIGSEVPVPCGVGYYSRPGQASCEPCLSGHYCVLEATSYMQMGLNYRCPAGLYCDTGLATVPHIGSHACHAGHYCPEGVPHQIPCPPGTMNPLRGQSELAHCVPCTAGSYCLEGSVNETAPCDTGFFCEAGATGPRRQPCPGGSYRSTRGATSSGDCAACPWGSYCPEGSTEPELCPRGSYCPPSAAVPVPCPIGSFGNKTGLRLTEECQQCYPGHFCDGLGLTGPTGLCDPGYFCSLGSFTSQPRFPGPPFLPSPTEYGGLCPRGGYCPAGSSAPTPCPQGTFLNVTGASTDADCITCTPGFYCASTASPGPTGPCFAGYYCGGGAKSPTENEAPPGTYTTEGASQPVPCAPGTYNSNTRQAECQPCLVGHFCPNQTTTSPTPCPAGHYCIQGTVSPERCPPGTFSNDTHLEAESECQQCPPGYFCQSNGQTAPSGKCSAGYYCTGGAILGQPVLQTYGDRCPAGHFCGEGSSAPVPCPLGTYFSGRGIDNEGSCLPCPARRSCNGTGLTAYNGDCAPGYYCVGGATSPTPFPTDATGGICPRGHYCPGASNAPLACAPSWYMNSTGASECLSCPAGFYCPDTAQEQPVPCPTGKYCPASTGATPFNCEIGTFGPSQFLRSQAECSACTPGSYCATPGLSAPTALCDAGFYCPGSSTSSLGADTSTISRQCPQGHYCEQGSFTPTPCGTGYYAPAAGNRVPTACVLCEEGFYCDAPGLAAPVGPCDAGHFCRRGATSAAPTDGVTIIDGGIVVGGDACPTGAYCPQQTGVPLLCAAGTYNDVPGETTACSTCPASFYCPTNTSSFLDFPCPPGYVCPEGTKYASQHPCPAGTYNPSTLRQNITDGCQLCPPGQYCGGVANAVPDGNCTAGYYCRLGATSPTPTDGITGGSCTQGEYCPAGSAKPEPCTGGMYCADGTGIPTGQCTAGYFCEFGAWTPTPVNASQGGGVCTQGHYCPTRSVTPTACLPGTYNGATGSQSVEACLPCQATKYCPDAGQPASVLDCLAGFYCPGGDVVPTLACPLGHLCRTGSQEPEPCPPGTFQNATGQSECHACPERYYCPINGTVTPIPCAPGHYCPLRTTFREESPCPPGTFSNATMLARADECTQCLPGQYCFTAGLVEPTAPCAAGHYCLGGSSVPAPADGFDNGYACSLSGVPDPDSYPEIGDMCPPGHYCPLGTPTPVPCPSGTFLSTWGHDAQADCEACWAGYTCPTTGTVVPSRPCDAGFYCPGGQSVAVHQCPTGKYCPLGSIEPLGCAPGSYQGEVQQPACDPCPERFYCGTNTSIPVPCPPGMFCPGNTTYASEFQCPPGTYSNATHLASVDECLPCPAGWYCGEHGLTGPSGLCDAGWYCHAGSSTPQPAGGAAGAPCTAGHYCDDGSQLPVACPPGTFTGATGNGALSDCEPCTAGFICPVSAIVAPSEPCPATFYCPGGQASATHSCTAGHFCVAGLHAPTPCPAGEYQDELGQSTCKPCPARAYCLQGTSTPTPCPVGHYCPAGTLSASEHPCPAGTFNNVTGLGLQSECTPCTPGYYCAVPGLSEPTGPCGVGHYCSGGASVPQPDDGGATGGKCDAGYVCTGGASVPNPRIDGRGGGTGYECPVGSLCTSGITRELGCPPGQYNPVTTQSECLPCPLGRACPGNNTFSVPCPASRYCPGGSVLGTPCPDGTYSNATDLESADACTQCPAGQYCTGGVITGPCSAGFICHFGSPAPDQNDVGQVRIRGEPCPAGHYCPLGTELPIQCPNGTVRADRGGEQPSDCSTCPQGSICYVGDPVPKPCPTGHYCTPEGAFIRCPMGTSNSQSGTTNITACRPCPAGYLCDQEAITDFDDFPCPVGHFCPVHSLAPIECQAGSYRPSVGAGSQADCLTCPAGHFCVAQSSAPEICPAATFCPPGSAGTTPCPAGSYCPVHSAVHDNGAPILCPPSYSCAANVFEPTACPDGTYCPAGSSAPLYCPLGTKTSLVTSNTSRAVLEDACVVCPPGTYGADDSRLVCATCPAGYVCLGGTEAMNPTSRTHDKGYECPTGHYCPEGSSVEIPCPVGTYNALTRQASSDACIPCDAGFFASTDGSASCQPCSSSSRSTAGSPTCECIGLNRVFQPTDRACICRSNYEPSAEFAVTGVDADGTSDCQPIVFDRCLGNLVRDAEGNCVTSDELCATQCGASVGGVAAERTGTCECNLLVTVDSVCNNACRSAAPTLSVDPLTGQLALTAAGVTVSMDPASLVEFAGSVTCHNSATSVDASGQAITPPLCQMYQVAVDANGFSGTYGVTTNLAAAANDARRRLIGTPEDLPSPAHHARFLAAVDLSAQITQPVLCLSLNDGIMFDLSDSYPVYQKDSLLNTNPSFDYGEFRHLAELARSTSSVKLFGYTFTEPGVYVFGTSTDANKRTIIRVMEAGSSCPTAGPIMPMTTAALIQVGVQKTSDIIQAPNWPLIIGLMLVMFSVVGVTVFLLYYFQTRKWETGKKVKPRYRDTIKTLELNKLHAKGSIVTKSKLQLLQDPAAVAAPGSLFFSGRANKGKDDADIKLALTAAAGGKELDRWDAEDLDLREIVERLEHHHDVYNKAFDRQSEHTASLLKELHDEADTIKRLLATAAVEQTAAVSTTGGTGTNTQQAGLLRRIEAELAARSLHDRNMARHEDSILAALNLLIECLEDGPRVVSDTIVTELTPEQEGILLFDENEALADDAEPSDNANKTSPTADKVLELLSELLTRINTFTASVEKERDRRRDSVGLLSAASKAGLLDESSHVAKGLQTMLRLTGPLNELIEQLVGHFGTFHDGVIAFPPHFRHALGRFLEETAAAKQEHDDGRASAVAVETGDRLNMQLELLMQHVLDLLRHFHALKGTIDNERSAVSANQDTVIGPLTRKVEEAERDAQSHDPRSRLQDAVDKFARLLDQRDGHQASRASLADNGRRNSDAMSYASEVAAVTPAVSSEAAARIKAVMEAEHAEAKAKLDEEQDSDRAAAAQQQQRRREAAEAALAGSDVTEEERARLMAEFEDSQAKLDAAMEMERRRQAADLQRRLAQRAEERLQRKIRQAEARAAQELADQQAAEEAQMQANHAAQLNDLEAEAAKEEADAGLDAEDDVSEHVKAIRAAHDRELNDLDARAQMERRRQKAALEQRLRLRAARRARELEVKQQRELEQAADAAEATGDTGLVDRVKAAQEDERLAAAVQTAADAEAERVAAEQAVSETAEAVEQERARIMAQYEEQIDGLANQLQNERARQRASLQERLRARREAKQRDLHRRQVAELEAAKLNDGADADLSTIRARHAEESKALVSDLDKEDAEDTANFERRVAVAEAAVNAEKEAERIRTAHEEEVAAMRRQQELERRRQHAELAKKLEERRTRRLEALRRQQAHRMDRAAEVSAEEATRVAEAAVSEEKALLLELMEDESHERQLLDKRIAAQESGQEATVEEKRADVEAAMGSIRAKFEEELEMVLSREEVERRRQQAALRERLAKRKARHAAALRERQQQEAIEAAIAEETAKAAAAAEAVTTALNSEPSLERAIEEVVNVDADEKESPESEEARAALLAAQERERLELEAQQEEERKRAEAEAEAEAKRELEERLVAEERERRAALAAKREEMEARVRAMNLSSEDEVKAKRQEFEAELATLETSMETERARQRARLQRRVEAKRKRRERALLRKQEKQMAEKVAEQERAAAEAEAEKAKEREAMALERVMENGNVDKQDFDEAVDVVVRRRHTQETSALLSRQYKERAMALQTALEEVFEARRDAKAETLDAMRDEGASQAAIDERMAAIDREFSDREAQAEAKVTTRLEAKHAREQLELREKQLGEVHDMYQRLAPEEVLERHRAEESKRQANELAKFREDMEKEKADRLRRIEEEHKREEEELKKSAEQELAAMEAEHQRALEEQRTRAEARMQERKRTLQKQQEEERQRRLEEAGAQDEEERDRVMREWEEDTMRMNARLEAEKERQQEKLRQRLAKRRERQMKLQRQRLEKELRERETIAKQRAEAIQQQLNTHEMRLATGAYLKLRKNAGKKASAQSVARLRVLQMADPTTGRAKAAFSAPHLRANTSLPIDLFAPKAQTPKLPVKMSAAQLISGASAGSGFGAGGAGAGAGVASRTSLGISSPIPEVTPVEVTDTDTPTAPAAAAQPEKPLEVEQAAALQRRLSKIEAVIFKLNVDMAVAQLPLYRDPSDSQYLAEGELRAASKSSLNDTQRTWCVPCSVPCCPPAAACYLPCVLLLLSSLRLQLGVWTATAHRRWAWH